MEITITWVDLVILALITVGSNALGAYYGDVKIGFIAGFVLVALYGFVSSTPPAERPEEDPADE